MVQKMGPGIEAVPQGCSGLDDIWSERENTIFAKREGRPKRGHGMLKPNSKLSVVKESYKEVEINWKAVARDGGAGTGRCKGGWG